MSVMQQDRKPPHVRFVTEPVEDRNASIQEGRPIFTDQTFAVITAAGSKDNVKRPVTEWFQMLRKEVQQERFPLDWLQHYERAFEHWQKGEELPLTGTPIRLWPVVTPAQCQMLLDLHVLTVEDLAVCNEETITRLGMGGRALKQKAVDYLASANDHGKVVLELESLRRDLDTSLAENKELREQLDALSQQLTQLTTVMDRLTPDAPSTGKSAGKK